MPGTGTCSDGVFDVPLDGIRRIDALLPSTTWYLFDSGSELSSNPSRAVKTAHARIVQAASIAEFRAAMDRLSWVDEMPSRGLWYAMKPSGLKEILLMKHYHPIPKIRSTDDKTLSDFLQQIRPIPTPDLFLGQCS
ncbi:hypothetical protein VNI00_014259 [Paramarasmius palmivorus]|uniref:Uncharacterized protein n=1 Tax=Paramarasmius palmivorus TaxID=297713 RepID=A0AAW0BW34_9AGAR